MNLFTKGDKAGITDFTQLVISIRWTVGVDFDLACVYQTVEGEYGMVYYGDTGCLEAFPYLKLSADAGSGDEKGHHEERVKISNISAMRHIWFLCWDYTQITQGAPARFSESDLSLIFKDDRAHEHKMTIDTGDFGNVSLIAEIDNTDPENPALVNLSQIGTLKRLESLGDVISFIEKA